MDEGTAALVAAVRPLLKAHIGRTRDLLAFMTELDKRLDAQSQEAEPYGNDNGKQTRAA